MAVARLCSERFQFRFLSLVLHKNEKLLRCLIEIFRIVRYEYFMMVYSLTQLCTVLSIELYYYVLDVC